MREKKTHQERDSHGDECSFGGKKVKWEGVRDHHHHHHHHLLPQQLLRHLQGSFFGPRKRERESFFPSSEKNRDQEKRKKSGTKLRSSRDKRENQIVILNLRKNQRSEETNFYENTHDFLLFKSCFLFHCLCLCHLCLPFFSSFFSWFFLLEKEWLKTWVTICFCKKNRHHLVIFLCLFLLFSCSVHALFLPCESKITSSLLRWLWWWSLSSFSVSTECILIFPVCPHHLPAGAEHKHQTSSRKRKRQEEDNENDTLDITLRVWQGKQWVLQS